MIGQTPTRIALLAAAAALAACAPTRPERPMPAIPEPTHPQVTMGEVQPPQAPAGSTRPRSAQGNPPFYEVMGERYHVLDESDGYAEQGVASWYGREFHGRRTSSGEVYDMYALTAAHKTLPLPTDARVTNLTTGKSIVVRINDRGPFKKGRLIDLSYGAARELGFLTNGTALVEVTALAGPGAGPDVGEGVQPARSMYVQVGAFGKPQNAEQLKHSLEKQGFRNVVIRYDARAEPALYRVRIGPVASAAEFDAVASKVSRLNIGDPRLVVENDAAGMTAAEAAGAPGG